MRSATFLAALGALVPASLPAQTSQPSADTPLRVGFLLLEGIYNSELAAPFDVFHHSVFHTEPGMQVFTVGRTTDVVRSFEGLRITPDYDLDNAPAIDVLVVPSAEHNMDSDLEDERLIGWIAERGAAAQYILSVCDGAFLLAEAGLLEGHKCTTFPGDLPAFRQRYPELDVVENVSFVADGRAITGAGGAVSYDPAMYLVEKLYGKRVAEGIGRGLVIDWKLDAVEHLVADGAGEVSPPPSCYLPGEQVSPDIAVTDYDGEMHRLGNLVEAVPETRAVVLYIIGAAAKKPQPATAGMWCEDSFHDLAIMNRLTRDFGGRGVLFVPILCPPVYDESRFGYRGDTFLSDDLTRFTHSRFQFVAASQRLMVKGLLPFEKVWFDGRFHLLANPEHGVADIPAPPWQGKLKWYEDSQVYGTPTLWVLRADLRVYGKPFFGNNYQADGGKIRYTERDVAARLERLLRESE